MNQIDWLSERPNFMQLIPCQVQHNPKWIEKNINIDKINLSEK